jgi:hypothetical protein
MVCDQWQTVSSSIWNSIVVAITIILLRSLEIRCDLLTDVILQHHRGCIITQGFSFR